MRNGRTIFNGLDRQSCRLKCRDGAFSARPRSLNPDFHFLNPEFRGLFRCLLSSTLAGEGGAFAAALKTTRPSTRPTQGISLDVRNRYGRVVERGFDMSDRHRHVPASSFLSTLSHFNPTPNIDFDVVAKFPPRRLAPGSPRGWWLLSSAPARSSRPGSPNRHAGILYRKSLTPFFPATVFRGPLRVRALVLVRCPRTGSPTR